MFMLEVAEDYTRRGWRLIPIPHQAKNPGIKAWQQMRLDESALPAHFNGKPQNVGVLLGEPSGWLIDVDLDHALAVEKAAEYLPPTPLRFGRQSKPESHWIYRVRGTVATKQYRSKSAGTIVELRSTGCQTVFPPSTHESGELIEFVDPLAEPAEIDADALFDAVAQLARAVLVQLGEKSPPRAGKDQQSSSKGGDRSKSTRRPAGPRVARARPAGNVADADRGSPGRIASPLLRRVPLRRVRSR